MEAYKSFYERYQGVADIYILYILEAHFVEKDADGRIVGGWPIGSQYNHPQHRSLEDRRSMVSLLLDEFHPAIPIYMDTMENSFQNVYRPWPDRAFVFCNGEIRYMAKINDDGSRNSFWTEEISKMLDGMR
jgi:hypothetical protein